MLPADFHLENRFYYSRLNPSEKHLYVFMVELLLKRQRQFLYTFDAQIFSTCEEYKGLPSFSYKDESDDINYYTVFEAIRWDCPEFYFISMGDLDWNNLIITLGTNQCPYTDEEMDEIDNKLYGILHNFDHITDPFELELEVHDYITRNFDYEYNFAPEDTESHHGREYEEIFTPVSLIKTGRGVCGGIIRLAQFIFQRRGLEVVNILAKAGEEGNKHEHSWLGIKLGGHYYHLDITFNEGSTNDKTLAPYEYFNVPTDEILDSHDFTAEDYPEIICDHTEYNYYNKFGLYFETYEQITLGVEKHLDSIPFKHGETYHFYFKHPRSLDVEKITTALWRAIEHKKIVLFEREFAYDDTDGYFVLEYQFDKFE